VREKFDLAVRRIISRMGSVFRVLCRWEFGIRLGCLQIGGILTG
jgi:hypothetical protein